MRECRDIPITADCISAKPVERLQAILEETLFALGAEIVNKPSTYHYIVGLQAEPKAQGQPKQTSSRPASGV